MPASMLEPMDGNEESHIEVRLLMRPRLDPCAFKEGFDRCGGVVALHQSPGPPAKIRGVGIEARSQGEFSGFCGRVGLDYMACYHMDPRLQTHASRACAALFTTLDEPAPLLFGR